MVAPDAPAWAVALEASLRDLTREVRELKKALPPLLVSVEEAAQRLNFHPSTIRRKLKDGDLREVRIGRSVRVDLSTLHPADEGEIASKARALRRVG